MKKHYFLAATAALALWSCTSNEVDNLPAALEESNAIGFGTFLPRIPQGYGAAAPKASNLTATLLQTNGGFKAFAYYTASSAWSSGSLSTAPDFMDADVTWATSSWTYSPIKYWPKLGSNDWGKVSFFGFSKAGGAAASYAAGAVPTITFTTQESASAQVDLVADTAYDRTGGDNGGMVKFNFAHILSMVGFSAKLQADYADATVKVKSLKLYYKVGTVKKAGTYTFPTRSTPGGWVPAEPYFAHNAAGDQLFSGEATLSTAPSNLCGTDKYLMLIPQEITTAGDMYVELEYSVTTATPDLTVTNTATINLPATPFGLGKAYTFIFSLTLNPVVFDTNIEVGPWGVKDDIIPIP
ncbi:MAG: fimbrillin family protein [Prevotellaceae bacterium]|jgi:hypothetical protein|nr:fimbrillin family protein [Prevotellaceae bacterium]